MISTTEDGVARSWRTPTRCLLLALASIPVGLGLILGDIYATAWGVRDAHATAPLGQLPLPVAVYAVFVFPFIRGLTEQMTYDGSLALVPVLCRSNFQACSFIRLRLRLRSTQVTARCPAEAAWPRRRTTTRTSLRRLCVRT